jgi:hypothetical protein
LSHPILVPILFSATLNAACCSKTCLAQRPQPNDCYNLLPTAQVVHRTHIYLLVCSSSLVLPTPRWFRRSSWGRPCRGQVRRPAALAPYLHSGVGGGGGFAIGIASMPSASASALSRRLSGGGVGRRLWRRLLRLDALTKFEFSNLYRSTCSLHVQRPGCPCSTETVSRVCKLL